MEIISKAQKPKKDLNPQPTFPLALASEGEGVKIISCRGGGGLRERLLSMGIHIDDKIMVIQKQYAGAMLIEKMGNRFALGGGMAQKITVSRY